MKKLGLKFGNWNLKKIENHLIIDVHKLIQQSSEDIHDEERIRSPADAVCTDCVPVSSFIVCLF